LGIVAFHDFSHGESQVVQVFWIRPWMICSSIVRLNLWATPLVCGCLDRAATPEGMTLWQL
jgi:hypothetical protein